MIQGSYVGENSFTNLRKQDKKNGVKKKGSYYPDVSLLQVDVEIWYSLGGML